MLGLLSEFAQNQSRKDICDVRAENLGESFNEPIGIIENLFQFQVKSLFNDVQRVDSVSPTEHDRDGASYGLAC